MSEELIKRLESSIEFITDDLPIRVGDFVLGRADSGRKEVKGYIESLDKPNIPKQELQDIMADMKQSFLELADKSEKFSLFVKERGVDYWLLGDIGKAGVALCSEIEGVFHSYI
jgi:hypothetical protein